jgi:hypothetical protein
MDRIGSLLERPKAYYNIDGVGELGIGFMLLCYTLFKWIQAHAPQHSIWDQAWVFWIYFGLMLSIIHYGSKAIKERITYPRTGFVEYRKRDTFWRPFFIAMAVSALSVGLFLTRRAHWDMTTLALLIGLYLAASYAYGFARRVRWKWAVACAMACGSVTIALLPADRSWAGAFELSMPLYGALFMVSGGISFWLYLRHTQAPAQDAQ